jgi:hypothetical protein
MLAVMAYSWPELCVLELSCMHQPVRQIFEGTLPVTLRGIEVLTARCPELTRLHVPLDTTSVRTWIPNRSQKPTELERFRYCTPEIGFQHSKIRSADVKTLAAALVRIFPTPWGLAMNFELGYGLVREAQQDGLEEPVFHAEMDDRKRNWDQVAARMGELQRAE